MAVTSLLLFSTAPTVIVASGAHNSVTGGSGQTQRTWYDVSNLLTSNNVAATYYPSQTLDGDYLRFDLSELSFPSNCNVEKLQVIVKSGSGAFNVPNGITVTVNAAISTLYTTAGSISFSSPQSATIGYNQANTEVGIPSGGSTFDFTVGNGSSWATGKYLYIWLSASPGFGGSNSEYVQIDTVGVYVQYATIATVAQPPGSLETLGVGT